MRKLPYVFTKPQLTDVERSEIRLMLVMAKHKPHVAVGDVMRMEAPDDRRRLSATCALRAKVVLTPGGLLRVTDIRNAPDGEGLANLLRAAEQGAPAADRWREDLAGALGHASWDDLYARERARAGRGGKIVREVIGWDGLLARELA